jgi:altronate dehydratase
MSTSTALWNRQGGDIDLNRGEILKGKRNIPYIAQEIFRLMLIIASEQSTKSEIYGYE